MRTMTMRVHNAPRPCADQACMYCDGAIGHWERVYTADRESLDGWEDWFCCHACRDAGHPCETFHRIPIPPAEARSLGIDPTQGTDSVVAAIESLQERYRRVRQQATS